MSFFSSLEELFQLSEYHHAPTFIIWASQSGCPMDSEEQFIGKLIERINENNLRRERPLPPEVGERYYSFQDNEVVKVLGTLKDGVIIRGDIRSGIFPQKNFQKTIPSVYESFQDDYFWLITNDSASILEEISKTAHGYL